MMRRILPLQTVFVLVLLIVISAPSMLVASASFDDAKPKEAGKTAVADGVAKVEVERGPVRVVVALTPGKPRLSDEPMLTVTIDADEAIKVTPPPFGDSIGGFIVRSFHESLPQLANGRRVLRQNYRLEANETGTHTIPAIEFTFVDGRTDGDGKEHKVETDPLVVEVVSLIGDAAPTLDQLRPPIAPTKIEEAREWNRSWLLPIAAGVALVVGLIYWRARRKPTVVSTPTYTPSELADRELRELLDDDPLSRGELQTFFVELTLVVRRFIERTTTVRAPEQTTDEFLRSMRTAPGFDDETRERLKSFLQAADLVKFARMSPENDEIEESFRLAQEFVGLPGTLHLREAVTHGLAGETPE